MCGIVGIAGSSLVANRLVDGLKRLEYRGYDSAGIAVISDQKIYRLRAEGKLSALERLSTQNPLTGHTGIGHTRWATHGKPTEANAHPHATERVALVHNGIIENFNEIKHKLEKAGTVFTSQTDTEVILHLIDRELLAGATPEQAVINSVKRLEGAFALGIIFAAHDGLIIAARKGSPLAVGYGSGETYMGSDAIALSTYTSKISYLEDGDIAVLTPAGIRFLDESGKEVTRAVKISSLSNDAIGKEGFRHFMLKEIHEQPTVIGQIVQNMCDLAAGEVRLPAFPFAMKDISSILLIACGTSYYSAQVARYWLQEFAGVPVYVDVASEYRYQPSPLPKNTLAIFISQSGETADTLAALRTTKQAGHCCLAVVNVPESTMALEADVVLHTHAGPEIGVASTKGFTTQLATLACLVIGIAHAKESITTDQCRQLQHALAEVPSRMVEALHNNDAVIQAATLLADARDILYIGRGTSHIIAMEGALKLKEISYIHAEGYAAGELKHGPIALLDENVPVVAIAPSSNAVLFEKTASNIQEAAARGAKIIVISDAHGCKKLKELSICAIEMPNVDSFSSPLLYSLPIQLLAYHVAIMKGTDVDQPRNLAKSVTVE